MKEVIFKTWIKEEKKWSNFNTKGLFHQWGVSYEEFETGPANFSIAIVELEDGSIVHVLPFNLKFVERDSTFAAKEPDLFQQMGVDYNPMSDLKELFEGLNPKI